MSKRYCKWRVSNGTLQIPGEDRAYILQNYNNQEMAVTLEDALDNKSLKQIRGFHGPVLKGVAAYYKDIEGVIIKDLEKLKWELKCQFLPLRKRYFKDGTPVMVRLPGGESWQVQEVPSLAELKKSEMDQFISDIIRYFYEERGWEISINPPFARSVNA